MSSFPNDPMDTAIHQPSLEQNPARNDVTEPISNPQRQAEQVSSELHQFPREKQEFPDQPPPPYPQAEFYPPGPHPSATFQQGVAAYSADPSKPQESHLATGNIAQYPGQPNVQYVVHTPIVVQSPPPDNLVLSILACLCCCWPIGLCAIIYSCQAQQANKRADYQTALRLSTRARRFAIASIVTGIICSIIIAVIRLSINYQNSY